MSQLIEIIRAEIALRGVIPFARFMELALYCPEYGYYETESDTVGRAGDFYTSVSVGSLFGELLAFQFADWLGKNPAENLQLVEAGAHDGKLASDILRWLARWRPVLFERITYLIVEPSARREQWQRARLTEFANKVSWLQKPVVQPAAPINGVIFANELLDALVVHRLGWSAGTRQWFEWGVTVAADKFQWAKLPPTVSLDQFAALPPELFAALPDNFTVEICPGADDWWRQAAQSLQGGQLLTLDYGMAAEDFFAPHRSEGTLRAYRRHRVHANLLADPGGQDLTAHVNFTQIQKTGTANGLRTERFASQAEFLVDIAKAFWPEAAGRGEWSPQRNRELQTLLHPEHLGRAFRVLVQAR